MDFRPARARHAGPALGGPAGPLRGIVVALICVTLGALAGCGSGSGSATSASSASASRSATSGPSASGRTSSGSATSGPARAHVVITGTNSLRFAPMTVRVKVGTVRITLKDMGSYPHNIVIPRLHVRSKSVTGDPGGDTVTFTVRFPRPGTYPFHCQYHASAGMNGEFVAS